MDCSRGVSFLDWTWALSSFLISLLGNAIKMQYNKIFIIKINKKY